MRKNIGQVIGSSIGLFLFVAALWVLYHELKAYHYHDIIQSFKNIPSSSVLFALLFTALNYITLTGYDFLAFYYIHQPLVYGKIAFVSFISYAFGNNIGFSALSSSAVRYRLYSAWELSAAKITQIIVFCLLTFWIGYFTIGGIILISVPITIPETLRFSLTSTYLLGLFFLIATGGYLVLTSLRKRPINLKGLEFQLPSLRLSLAQMLIASIDWVLAGSVLYVLLPSSYVLSFPEYFGIYLIAQLAGLISNVPGGMGVFETVIIVLLSPTIPASSILGSLLAYRIIYYLFPLSLAGTMLAIHEIALIKDRVRQIGGLFNQWISLLVPHALSFIVFLSGVILLFSGSTPSVKTRLYSLRIIFPLPAIELSHFLGSLSGVALILLARGLQKRLDAAYVFTLVILGLGAIFSLLKGFDYEEAIILVGMFFLLLPCHRYFKRKASILNQHFTSSWILAIMFTAISSVWIGLFSYKNIAYSHELWWRFELTGDAPRFLRASVGMVISILFFSLAKLLKAAPPKPSSPNPVELESARTIAAASRSTVAYLALLGDKHFLFSRNKKAFLMYAVKGRSWISMGEPVGTPEEKKELIWSFRERCDQYDGWTVFYEVGKENLYLYIDMGLTSFKLGECALVPLETLSLEGRAHKEFRYAVHRLEREGCSFEIIPKEELPRLLLELKEISDAWLKEKRTSEKGFSLGFFRPEYLMHFPVAVIRQAGRILAFANIWLGAEKEELSIDLMRYRPESPHGTMDYLFLKLMLWGKQQGYRRFNLGMAPFSGLQPATYSPMWQKLGAFLYHHGEHFYNFQGLRQYKEKFNPEWEPRYLVFPGGLALPKILTNLASLVSGGMKGIITK